MTPKQILESGLKSDLLLLFTSPNPTNMSEKLDIFCEKLAKRIDDYTKAQINIDAKALISASSVTIPVTAPTGSPSFGYVTPPP
ncbi:MAG: hypothetical protein ABIK31_01645 [candidate division WOR-3 bacterium]